MATTPNFGWPTPDDTDLVRDGAAAIRALGDAIDGDAAGFGGLVEVKHALVTGTFFTSVDGGDNVAVPGLSVTHEVADPANRLIISAYFGVAGSTGGRGQVGIAVHDGAGLIGVGDAADTRTQVGAGGDTLGSPNDASTLQTTMPSVMFVHTPGAGSKTYTVRAINIRTDERTLYVNRRESDADGLGTPRAASALVIQEVRV